jgi:hypothetical protein
LTLDGVKVRQSHRADPGGNIGHAFPGAMFVPSIRQSHERELAVVVAHGAMVTVVPMLALGSAEFLNNTG